MAMNQEKLETMSGYMDKQSPKFPFPWQKRFFRFQLKPKPIVLYYQKPSDTTPKGTIAADKIAEVLKTKRTRLVISLALQTLVEITQAKPNEQKVKRSAAAVAETKENMECMKLVHKNLVAGLRQATAILQNKACFQKFAQFMEHQSYFDLGSFAPIFGNYFRAVLAFKNPNIEVNLKLDDVSSVDIEALKFLGFLDEVAETAFLPQITAEKMEALLNAAAQKTTEKINRYIKEAEATKDPELIGGLKKIAGLFLCLLN